MLHQRRGQAERKVLRQLQVGKRDGPGRRPAGEAADQHVQLVMQLRRLLDQRRQRGGGLGQLRLLCGDVEAARIALVLLVLQDLQRLGVGFDERAGGPDLLVDGGLLDRGDHHIGCQGGVSRDRLEADRLLLRLQRLHRPPVQPEHVGRVGDAHLRREEAVLEGVGIRRRSERLRLPLARCGKARGHAGEHRAPLRERGLVRHLQRRLRRLEVGVVGQRLIDQGVQGPGVEQGPPLAGNLGPVGEALNLAARRVGAGGGGR